MSDRAVKCPELEYIICDSDQSFRWHAHSFPHALARWNYHPEFEIHLITRSCGTVFIGDYIGDFAPGHLCLVGANLPHVWVSNIAPGEFIERRDIVLQFDESLLVHAAAMFPEFIEIRSFLNLGLRGLEFHGATAKRGAAILQKIGEAHGFHRLTLFFELIDMLARSNEKTVLAGVDYAPSLDPRTAKIMEDITSYVLSNLSREVRMVAAAKIAGMTASGFSRFFKKNTGRTFVEYVHKLRIGRACRILIETNVPITSICFDVGYNNVSNFNRHFRKERGVTPSAYKRMAGQQLLSDPRGLSRQGSFGGRARYQESEDVSRH
ncbi:AraC family transcriptional regulator [Beijerinckia indica]|uniref:Transcriptional regulator, AraC family n=1 Tax=Beijerinckia indica subsp. indica (strain ATCC 9039 / DSM 1715 / NCIMB 8712) TaxID=395963 RepID=B2ILE9_BEII9|nr:AraC family transcriptional regulator [Beijerinckia indica]ACB97349.1 transcriptional regulator, AraC family [Beijerinckia indica subsp. indica ATCC 9039]